MTRALIVGTGDMAHALCHLFKNHNFKSQEHRLAVSKPGLSHRILKQVPAFHDTGVPIVSLDDALSISDIIILAIPASALHEFLRKHFDTVRSKILVDVTNSDVPGEDLQAVLGFTGTSWVKAFNDNGAVDLLMDTPFTKKRPVTTVCGGDLQGVQKVKKFAQESLGFRVNVIPTDQYHQIAMHQSSLGDDWVSSTYVIITLFCLTEVYAILRYNFFKGYDWFHLPIQVTNKAICWTALNAFALTLLPGLLARLLNALHGRKMPNKPSWIAWGLRIRKPLGLLALWFLGIHIIMSLLIFNPTYYSKFFIDPSANSSKLNAIGESSFFFAIIGVGLYIILGICSLPSVGSEMTSRSWKLVYGPLAWLALVFGTTHVLIMGVAGWDDKEGWPGGLPPITLTSTLIPMWIMFLKLCQIAASHTIHWFFTEKDETPTCNTFLERFDPNHSEGIGYGENSAAMVPVYDSGDDINEDNEGSKNHNSSTSATSGNHTGIADVDTESNIPRSSPPPSPLTKNQKRDHSSSGHHLRKTKRQASFENELSIEYGRGPV